MLGKSPRDFDMDTDDWEPVTEEIDRAKNKYRNKLLKKLICKGKSTPAEVTQRIVEHCFKTTQSSRDFMEQNPGHRQVWLTILQNVY